MAARFAITIARQFGSGGREIGQRAAELLGIKAYDRELITLAAQKSGMSSEVLREIDEKATGSLLYTLAMGSAVYGSVSMNVEAPISDKLFITQSDVIREIASRESCVVIGRCADHVLRDHKNTLKVFIFAPMEERIKRIMRLRPELTEKAAKDMAVKTDKRRANYYNYYTGAKWGMDGSHALMIDSSRLGIEGSAATIAAAIKSITE